MVAELGRELVIPFPVRSFLGCWPAGSGRRGPEGAKSRGLQAEVLSQDPNFISFLKVSYLPRASVSSLISGNNNPFLLSQQGYCESPK